MPKDPDQRRNKGDLNEGKVAGCVACNAGEGIGAGERQMLEKVAAIDHPGEKEQSQPGRRKSCKPGPQPPSGGEKKLDRDGGGKRQQGLLGEETEGE